MSHSGEASAIIHEYYENLVWTYVGVATNAWSVYEYLITFRREVSIVWTQRPTYMTLLLITTRWVMLLNGILPYLPTPSYESCKGEYLLQSVVYIISLGQTALFSALRVFALRDRGYSISIVVAALGMVPLVVNAYATSTFIYTDSGADGCTRVISTSLQVSTICGNLPWFVDIGGYDRGLCDVEEDVQPMAGSSPAGYGMFSINMLATGRTLLAISLTDIVIPENSLGNQVASQLIAIAPPILVNRFIINLRSLNSPSGSSAGQNTQSVGRFSQFSAPNFRVPVGLVGNAGAPLVHGDPDARRVGDEDDDGDYGAGVSYYDRRPEHIELGDLSRLGDADSVLEL